MSATRRHELAWLTVILLLAASLRLYGVWFGLPLGNARPDEAALAGPAVMCLTGDCRPPDFYYPTGFIHVLALIYFGVFAVLRVAGVHPTLSSFLESRRVDISVFFLTSRLVSVVAGIATVYGVHVLGRRLWSPRVGLVASGYLAVSLLHVRDSHFGTTDVTMTALVLYAVLAIVRWQQTPSARWAVWAGIAGGAATTTKYNGLGVGLPFLVAAALEVASRPPRMPRRQVMLACVLALSAGVGTFLVLSPQVVLEWSRFVRDITVRSGSLAQPHGVDVGSGWAHHLGVTLPAAFGWPLYLWSAAGTLALLCTQWRQSIVVLAFPLAYLVVVGSLDTTFARYALPLLPFMALTAGWLTVATAEALASRLHARPAGALTVALAAALALPSLVESVRLVRVLARPDTRVLAAEVLLDHVAPDDTIYLSGRHYGHTPLALRDRRVPARGVAADADGHFPRQPDGSEAWPTWLVLHRSPLVEYSQIPARIDEAARTRYALVARIDATDPGHRGLYDQQDAWFLPLWGLRGVRHLGPSVEVWRRGRGPGIGSREPGVGKVGRSKGSSP